MSFRARVVFEIVTSQAFLYSFVGLIIGLTIGFVAANAVIQSESNNIRLNGIEAPPNQIKNSSETNTGKDSTLSAAEIRQAVRQADSNIENAVLQRDLGLSLYEYAKMQQQIELLPDVKRLLERAEKQKPAADFEVLTALGDVSLILSQQENSAAKLSLEARGYYEKALLVKPQIIELHTDLGSTYLSAQPPEAEKAVVEYRKTLAVKPNDERTLGFLIAALIALKKPDDARRQLEALTKVNPNNAALPDLQIQLAQLEIQK